MKTSILCIPFLLLLASPASDPTGDGLKLYAQGKYKEAAVAFQKALAARPDDPRLNYNLALALWRAGDPDGAEAAVEKAAAGADGSFDGLRDGILGNLRYDQAKAVAATAKTDPQKEVEVLEQAVQLAGTARDHFASGAVTESGRRRDGGAELVRNLERAIKLEEELKKQLEDAKKRREEQKKKDEQNKKNDQKKKQDDKKDQQKKDDPDKQDQKPDEQKKDDKQEDKEPEEKKKPEKKKDQKKKQPQKKPEEDEENKPHEAQKPEEVPGEHDPTKRLSPEQKRQLLKKLKDAEQKLQAIRAARKARRPKVKKDW